MELRNERYYVGDNAGRHADSMSGATMGVGGLLLLFIFLAIIAWAVSNGHDRTRDGVRDGNAFALAVAQNNQTQVNALSVAFARSEGANDAKLAILLANSDRALEQGCGLARMVESVAPRIIQHGDNWGFRSMRREPCCGGHGDGGGGGGTTVYDFNSGVQAGMNMATRGITNQQV